MMRPCEHQSTDGEDRWDLTEDGHLKHRNTGLCVDHQLLNVKKFLYVTECDPNSMSQRWKFEH
jgi:polypeptide N-acetylgalactosaminyltransferase